MTRFSVLLWLDGEEMPEGWVKNGEEDYRNDRNLLQVVVDGAVILTEFDQGEPEDNSFVRDWGFVPRIIARAYKIGWKHGVDSLTIGQEG